MTLLSRHAHGITRGKDEGEEAHARGEEDGGGNHCGDAPAELVKNLPPGEHHRDRDTAGPAGERAHEGRVCGGVRERLRSVVVVVGGDQETLQLPRSSSVTNDVRVALHGQVERLTEKQKKERRGKKRKKEKDKDKEKTTWRGNVSHTERMRHSGHLAEPAFPSDFDDIDGHAVSDDERGQVPHVAAVRQVGCGLLQRHLRLRLGFFLLVRVHALRIRHHLKAVRVDG